MSVVDASIVVRLLQNRRTDDALRRRFAELRTVHAPTLIDAEVAAAIRGLLLASHAHTRITQARAAEMVTDYADLPLRRYPVLPLQVRLLELRHTFTAYDACYGALAEALERPLLTDDQKFRRAPVVGLTIDPWMDATT